MIKNNLEQVICENIQRNPIFKIRDVVDNFKNIQPVLYKKLKKYYKPLIKKELKAIKREDYMPKVDGWDMLSKDYAKKMYKIRDNNYEFVKFKRKKELKQQIKNKVKNIIEKSGIIIGSKIYDNFNLYENNTNIEIPREQIKTIDLEYKKKFDRSLIMKTFNITEYIVGVVIGKYNDKDILIPEESFIIADKFLECLMLKM